MSQTLYEILRNKNPFSIEVRERESEYVVSFDDAIEAMKLYAIEKVKEVVRRYRTQVMDDKPKAFKSVDEIALQVIKEIE